MPLDDDRDAHGQDAPTGLDLGRLLRSDDSRTEGRLDVDAVIRRSRRRRGTRIAGLTTAWVLAGTLVIGGGIAGLRQLAPGSSSGSAASVASGSAGGKADGTGGAEPSVAPSVEDAADPRCGSPAPAATALSDGLAATITLPAGTTASGMATLATVTITNTGATTVNGSAEQPRGLLVRDDVVTWHSPVIPTVSPRSIHLAPGASTSFAVDIVALGCTVGQDDSATLPSAAAGTYLALASIVVHLTSGDEVIVSRTAHLRIR